MVSKEPQKPPEPSLDSTGLYSSRESGFWPFGCPRRSCEVRLHQTSQSPTPGRRWSEQPCSASLQGALRGLGGRLRCLVTGIFPVHEAAACGHPQTPLAPALQPEQPALGGTFAGGCGGPLSPPSGSSFSQPCCSLRPPSKLPFAVSVSNLHVAQAAKLSIQPLATSQHHR